LTWLHHLSNGDVKLGYLSKTYIVNMSTFQVKGTAFQCRRQNIDQRLKMSTSSDPAD
jgi:hypothetical protein